MPRAPPTSRVVSLTADPTPALAWGTALMMLPVAGAAVRLMPAPRRTRATTSIRYGEEGRTKARTAKPAATRRNPDPMTGPDPLFSAIAALLGATATSVRASGRVARPALSGE